MTGGGQSSRWACFPMTARPIGARSLCDLMDKLDALYPSGG